MSLCDGICRVTQLTKYYSMQWYQLLLITQAARNSLRYKYVKASFSLIKTDIMFFQGKPSGNLGPT